MRQMVEATRGFGKISIDQGCLELLKIIKDVAYNFQSQKKLSHALFLAKSAFYHYYQGKMTTPAYSEMIQNILEVSEHSGGTIGKDDT